MWLGAGFGASQLLGAQSTAPATAPLFIEQLPSSSGIEWKHENAMSANRYLPETMGPGCAFLDYDNDGWMDIYMVNSGPCDFWTPPKPIRNALYRNNRDGTFTDVTEKAGVMGGTFGMGIAVGDFDNDGWPDIFVTWAFLDYDNDGWMDIYLVNSGPCDFYKPKKPIRNALYKNNRDGTFTDVTEAAGVPGGTFGMGVAAGDYDNDGFPGSLCHRYGRPHSLPQQRRWHVYRRQREGRIGATSSRPLDHQRRLVRFR